MLKQHAWKIILLSFACWAAISTFDLAFNFCTRISSTLESGMNAYLHGVKPIP